MFRKRQLDTVVSETKSGALQPMRCLPNDRAAGEVEVDIISKTGMSTMPLLIAWASDGGKAIYPIRTGAEDDIELAVASKDSLAFHSNQHYLHHLDLPFPHYEAHSICLA